jgi:phosphomannomutase
MTLISSISGIRGTIGGKAGTGLTPDDVVRFTAAFGTWIIRHEKSARCKVIVGRDGRISGATISNIVCSTLVALGIDVIDLGLSTTPTVEIAVTNECAAGGIIITASHNPKQWNALKFLNNKGEFITNDDGKLILEISEKGDYTYAENDRLGVYKKSLHYFKLHIDRILKLPLIDIDAIKKADFKIVVDAVNSTGGLAVPLLLRSLGVSKIVEINCKADGKFTHNPEPLPENLSSLSSEVRITNADLGIAIDPDVDRLALVCEDGEFFGEEYTLVAVADYILQNTPGNTVSNLSSTRALEDITLKYGQTYSASAVGEVNVVARMKETNAVIGGEGNGGIIYPPLHYGRDALVGIALFLTHLAKSGKSMSVLRNKYPNYYISKNKIDLTEVTKIDTQDILDKITEMYKKYPINTSDGVRIDFDRDWVHLRKSNTEAVIRIYAESNTQTMSDNLAKKIISDIKRLIN